MFEAIGLLCLILFTVICLFLFGLGCLFLYMILKMPERL